jgi:hypothetical protein
VIVSRSSIAIPKSDHFDCLSHDRSSIVHPKIPDQLEAAGLGNPGISQNDRGRFDWAWHFPQEVTRDDYGHIASLASFETIRPNKAFETHAQF